VRSKLWRWWSLTGLTILGAALALGLLAIPAACPPASTEAPPVQVTIPEGATFTEVVATLDEKGIVARPLLFRIYARLRKLDREVKAGRYALPSPAPWATVLRDLTEGRVLTEALTLPEGFTLKQMAPRIAGVTGMEADSVLARLSAESAVERWEVPGPTLEGYLFPDTYRFAPGVPLREVLATLVGRYREVWTPRRMALRDSLEMSEREVVTLASIVQAEARLRDEMPIIASVYHNRLRRGQLLQADPTVLYALGGPRARLLYAAMDSVADHPYNTYTHPGLPPGPIGNPGLRALDATLQPAKTEFYYFVARPDGTHIFSRTLVEHNRAVARMRQAWDRWRRDQEQGEGGESRP
jgi:UPF0755 protein